VLVGCFSPHRFPFLWQQIHFRTGVFMGEVMKRSGGKADPKMATKLLREALGE